MRSPRRTCLYQALATLLVASACVLGTFGQAQQQPNIVFILADDVGIGDLGPYGQTTIQTPAFNQLAAEGTRFTQMYSGAPVCSPSRAILMTGLHNGRHVNGNGVNLRDENVTVAETLRSAGYRTGGFGKWHLGGSGASLPTNQGFDEYYGILGGVAAWDHFAPTMQRLTSAAPSTIINEANRGGFTDDLVGAEAAQFIRDGATGGEPFYAQVNFQLAHFDMEVPELEPYTINQPWPESRKIFASMISRLDRLVGNLVAAVDDPNGDGDSSDSIADNTLIVFASDNGTHIEPQNCCLGNHGPDIGVFSDDPHDPEFFDSNGQYRGWKRDLYDGGIKTPFLARWAGTVAAGATNDTLFGDFADFLPTAAELAGTSAPIGVDGVSYAHALTGVPSPTDQTKDFQYFEGGGSIGGIPTNPARRGLISDGMKAIQFANGAIELYDLEADPTESNNLYASQQALADEMIAIAVAEDRGPVGYSSLAATSDYVDTAFWAGSGTPGRNTIATITGAAGPTSEVFARTPVEALGVEIGDGVTPVRLVALPGRNVATQNGTRVNPLGTLRIEEASVSTNRRVELLGGTLAGRGDIAGNLLNDGLVTPDGATATPPDVPVGPNPALRFDFTGVQDDAPLTATSLLDPALTVVAGFDYGPGTQPRSAGPDGFTGSDQGNEFNAGGFNTGSLAGAIAAGDYLGYTVQPVAGFEMELQRVSFDLWRNGGNAANDYAILTSLGDFTAGSELGQLNNVSDQGAASERTFAAAPRNAIATEDAVEVRLYGWNANDDLANTHITAVALDATFTLTAPAAGEADPIAGQVRLDGNYVQTADGVLTIDIAGTTPGDGYDQLSITNTAHLDGTLEVSLAGGFTAQAGDAFDVLEAATIEGTFANEDLPALPGGLLLVTQYEANAVAVVVGGVSGDYNYDGVVNAADYTVWRDTAGATGNALPADGDGNGVVDSADLQVWQVNYGTSSQTVSRLELTIPEPSGFAVAGLSVIMLGAFRPERTPVSLVRD
ncbi:MAG: sulfatase-like hydrolase/transferase [Planctomycetota bacterium]